MSVIVMAPVESHKLAVLSSISLGSSSFVFILYRWLLFSVASCNWRENRITDKDCQQKMTITLKYISTIQQNKIAKPPNPSKQGIPRNHKP